MSAKKGIKKFGEHAVAAIIKEFSQLNERVVPGKPVMDTLDANMLSYKEKSKV